MNSPLEFWNIENLELLNIFKENKNLHGFWADEKTVNIPPFSIHHQFTLT